MIYGMKTHTRSVKKTLMHVGHKKEGKDIMAIRTT